MNVGIVGAGYIGRKRAESIAGCNDKIIGFADVDIAKAESLADGYGCYFTDDWHKLVNREDIEAIIAATTNNMLAKISLGALRKKKHVLCEKPLGINLTEASRIYEASRDNGCVVKAGFNHRFHPAIMEAHKLLNKGAIGEVMYIRAVYGHGGRKDYDKEWRMNPKLSGGGELLDQGTHLLDLFRWFMGDFDRAFAINANLFWKASSLEDNSFILLETKNGKIASAQISITQWKNKFLFEIFGKTGYLIIDGLGKSYGQEKLIFGKRAHLGKRPLEEVFEFPEEDNSWKLEWLEFTKAIHKNKEPLGSGYDGLKAHELLSALYKSGKQKRMVRI